MYNRQSLDKMTLYMTLYMTLFMTLYNTLELTNGPTHDDRSIFRSLIRVQELSNMAEFSAPTVQIGSL